MDLVGCVAPSHLSSPLLFVQTLGMGRQQASFLAVRKGKAGEGRGSSQTPRLERAAPQSSGSKSSPCRHGGTHEALTQHENRAAHSVGCLLLSSFPESSGFLHGDAGLLRL